MTNPPPTHETLKTSELLNDRYEVIRSLGTGGQGHTILAHDHQTDTRVAIKQFTLRAVESWKALELVEREATVLRSLAHPGVPRFIDSFEIASPTSEFFLVQQYIEGETLRTLLNNGQRWNETQIRSFLLAMLDILDYLHSFSPPIVHRDIKPDNIIVQPDGSLALIDFGAVQHILHDIVGGSTMVGTAGYLPPEQLMGRAVPASDLYALGATMLEMLSGTHPGDLPKKRMKLQFASLVKITPTLEDVLNQLLQPHIEERLSSALAVRTALNASNFNALQHTLNTSEFTIIKDHSIDCPIYAPRSTIRYTDMGLLIEIPSTLSFSDKIITSAIVLIILIPTLNGFRAPSALFWLMLLLIGFLASLFYTYFLDIWSDSKILISPEGYQIHRSIFKQTFTRTGSLKSLYAVDVHSKFDNEGTLESALLRFNTKNGKFDVLAAATLAEQQWAAETINNYLNEIRPSPEPQPQPLFNNDRSW